MLRMRAALPGIMAAPVRPKGDVRHAAARPGPATDPFEPACLRKRAEAAPDDLERHPGARDDLSPAQARHAPRMIRPGAPWSVSAS